MDIISAEYHLIYTCLNSKVQFLVLLSSIKDLWLYSGTELNSRKQQILLFTNLLVFNHSYQRKVLIGIFLRSSFWIQMFLLMNMKATMKENPCSP